MSLRTRIERLEQLVLAPDPTDAPRSVVIIPANGRDHGPGVFRSGNAVVQIVPHDHEPEPPGRGDYPSLNRSMPKRTSPAGGFPHDAT